MLSPVDPQTPGSELYLTREAGVATLWLNRPAKRNALTYDMWRGIGDLCQELADDPGVRALVVRGVGDHFCAGADIGGLAEMPLRDYHRANRHADESLATFPKPTVAYITGSCIGGGSELAASCDLRIAAEGSRFGITPARLGILYPAYSIERVTRLIGVSATKHLLFTGEIVDAERALRIGLVDELLPADEAPKRLDQLVATLRERSLLTQMASKAMVDAVVEQGGISEELDSSWHDALEASADPREGIAAFLERRTPTFRWTP
jgi:enoyl-CoA hydratase/carnithine racemase